VSHLDGARDDRLYAAALESLTLTSRGVTSGEAQARCRVETDAAQGSPRCAQYASASASIRSRRV